MGSVASSTNFKDEAEAVKTTSRAETTVRGRVHHLEWFEKTAAAVMLKDRLRHMIIQLMTLTVPKMLASSFSQTIKSRTSYKIIAVC